MGDKNKKIRIGGRESEVWKQCFVSTGGHRHQVHRQVCELLANTGTGEVLDRVGEEEELSGDLYRRYLHDYIRSVHQVTHKQSSVEYKVSCV